MEFYALARFFSLNCSGQFMDDGGNHQLSHTMMCLDRGSNQVAKVRGTDQKVCAFDHFAMEVTKTQLRGNSNLLPFLFDRQQVVLSAVMFLDSPVTILILIFKKTWSGTVEDIQDSRK